jgi:hypothetical protein
MYGSTHPAFVLPYVIAESRTAPWHDLSVIPRHQFDSLPVGAFYGVKVGHGVAAVVCQVLRGAL